MGKHIAEWLWKDENRRLVIFAKDDEESGKYTNRCKRDMKDRLRRNGEVNDESWTQIESQIYVEVNAEIFDFGLVIDKRIFDSIHKEF